MRLVERSTDTTPSPAKPAKPGAGLRALGLIWFLSGIAYSTYFYTAFDTSVEYSGGRVSNLSRMDDKRSGITVGGWVAAIGLVVVVLGNGHKASQPKEP